MKILITNHWLKKLGGSETFTYTLVKAAKKSGHSVDVFTFKPGLISDKIHSDFGVKNQIQSSYDVVLANHHTTVEHCHKKNIGPVIQTCHGIFPKLERPSGYANAYVAISEEIKNHIRKNVSLPISVIRNSIDIHRFSNRTTLAPRIMKILSLSHNAGLNEQIKQYCTQRNITFRAFNKYTNPTWNIESEILSSDLIISLGRGAYEALACGRPVLVLDKRPYQDLLADGYALPSTLDKLAAFNFSGRYIKQTPDNLPLYLEKQLSCYNDEDEIHYRHWALQNLDYMKNYQKYIDLWKTI